MSHRQIPIYDSMNLGPRYRYELTELFRYRYLLWNLILRDLKLRYKRSSLGFLWAMINPLLSMAVLVVVFSNLFRFDVAHYATFVLSGLLIWNYFVRGTVTAMTSLTDNLDMLKRVYVPPSVFVASAIGGALLNLFFAIIPLLALAILDGISPTSSWLFLPVSLIPATFLAFGVGAALASLAIFFVDIINIYEVMTSAYFYLTPIIYPAAILPPVIQRLEVFNPMFGLVNAFRQPLMAGRLPPLYEMSITLSLSVGVLVLGWLIFTQLANRFGGRI